MASDGMSSDDMTSSTYRQESDSGPSRNGDWPAQAADSIVRVVGSVRDKTTGPALLVARAVVYGVFAAVIGVAVVVLFGIASVRLVDNYLPDSVFGTSHTWAAHLIVGLVFVIAGGILWVRRADRSLEQSMSE